jgi:hypothetical protein
MPFRPLGGRGIRLSALGFFLILFRRASSDETIRRATKPFFAFGAEPRKRRMVIKAPTTTADSACGDTGDSQMRTLSVILAFAFVLAGASMAGSADNGLPGVGTFAYSGLSTVASGPQAVVVATR